MIMFITLNKNKTSYSRIKILSPGFDDLTPHAGFLYTFQELQTQMDLSLDFFIGVDPRQVNPAI